MPHFFHRISPPEPANFFGNLSFFSGSLLIHFAENPTNGHMDSISSPNPQHPTADSSILDGRFTKDHSRGLDGRSASGFSVLSSCPFHFFPTSQKNLAGFASTFRLIPSKAETFRDQSDMTLIRVLHLLALKGSRHVEAISSPET